MKPTTVSTCLLAVAAFGCMRPPAAIEGPTEHPAPALDFKEDAAGWPSQRCLDLAESLVGMMTLEEKVGQMTQPDRQHLAGPGDITKWFLGSVLSGGGSAPPDNTRAGWAKMVREMHAAALRTRLGIPLLYGVDAVHGHNNVPGAVIYPHNIGLGATRDPGLVERVARATAEEVAATGIDWTFAPVFAAARDERWGRTYEAFGETPELAALLGPAAIRGTQGNRLGGSATSILACAKHFVGDGGTTGGVDRGNTEVDEATLQRLYLAPYEAAVEAGVGSVMASYSAWNGKPLHAHQELLTVVLKEKLGFRGLVVSDWGGIDQLPGDYPTRVATAINAGIDMAMGNESYQKFITTLVGLVPKRVPQQRIDDAVTRILSVKCEMGRFDEPHREPSQELIHKFGGEEHRALAREAVRKSLVLLKNEGSVLPLPRDAKRVHVAGKSADDLGNQCGGWTVSWQGESGTPTVGTTVLAGMREVAPDVEITFSRDAAAAQGANATVVVVGETPYAEMKGDRQEPTLTPEDVTAIRNAKQAGAPVVVVLITGRPLVLGDVLQDIDALLVAWLPGSEGAGVADVLFGEPPVGKLGHSWPRSLEQVPINEGDDAYDPLFPYGFGLTYE